MLCSEHQRLTDWPLFRQSATRWLHSMRLCCAFAPRIVTLSISISSSPCDSLAVEGITSDNLQRLPQTRIDSMEVYESPLHSFMTGSRFQPGHTFDAYDHSNNLLFTMSSIYVDAMFFVSNQNSFYSAGFAGQHHTDTV